MANHKTSYNHVNESINVANKFPQNYCLSLQVIEIEFVWKLLHPMDAWSNLVFLVPGNTIFTDFSIKICWFDAVTVVIYSISSHKPCLFWLIKDTKYDGNQNLSYLWPSEYFFMRNFHLPWFWVFCCCCFFSSILSLLFQQSDYRVHKWNAFLCVWCSYTSFNWQKTCRFKCLMW